MNTYLINIELLHQINICTCFLLMHLKAYIVCNQKIKLLFLLVKRYFWLAYGFDVYYVGSGEQKWPEINVLEDTFCLKLFTTET